MNGKRVSITQSQAQDIPDLSAINASAYYPDPFFRTAWPDEATMVPFYAKRLQARFATPDTTVWMARDEAGRGVGFVALTLVEAKVPEVERPSVSVSQQALGSGTPDGLDMNMVRDVQAAVGPLMRHMTEKHYFLSAFAVSPSAQRRGVGTALLHKCISTSEADGIPIWLVALPSSQSLCSRHGFEVQDSAEMDLSRYARWDGKDEAVYRQLAMRRGTGLAQTRNDQMGSGEEQRKAGLAT